MENKSKNNKGKLTCYNPSLFMKCQHQHCKGVCLRKGKSCEGVQKYQCKFCKKYQREEYKRKAWKPGIAGMIQKMTKRGCGVRAISFILEISCTTVIKKTLLIAQKIIKPAIPIGETYEMDELKTYTGKKKRERWISYAIRRDTKEPVDFRVGRRTKKNLGAVVETLLLSEAKKIYTDGYYQYKHLIPGEIHGRQWYNTNHIERKNLSMRTHLKRLGRKTICFSKSDAMLQACVKIYLWG